MLFRSEVEVVAPWRRFDVAGQTHDQFAVTGAAGLRLRASLPLGATTALAFRYDVRIAPWQIADAVGEKHWATALTQGAALGVTFR